ncbi:MAG: hypothetical protein VX320_04395 [Candidatus Thermoplasmatota archaeon]|nr:hypothetical protein [Candidatus Thermoplasmatota archaeon]
MTKIVAFRCSMCGRVEHRDVHASGWNGVYPKCHCGLGTVGNQMRPV